MVDVKILFPVVSPAHRRLGNPCCASPDAAPSIDSAVHFHKNSPTIGRFYGHVTEVDPEFETAV